MPAEAARKRTAQVSVFQRSPKVVKRKKRSTEISVFDHGVERAPMPWAVPPAAAAPRVQPAPPAVPAFDGLSMRRTRSKGGLPHSASGLDGFDAIKGLLQRSDQSFDLGIEQALAPWTATAGGRGAPPAGPGGLAQALPALPALPMRRTRSSRLSGLPPLTALPMQSSISDVFGEGTSSLLNAVAGAGLDVADADAAAMPAPLPMRRTRSSRIPGGLPLQSSVSELLSDFMTNEGGGDDMLAMIGN